MRVKATAPVVALDIDGTVARYYDHFRWFVNTIYFPGRMVVDRWDNPGAEQGEFSEALGMDKAEYRAAKLAYRQGGLKRCIPPFTGLKEEIQHIRRNEIQVWVCTARPWMRLDNIDPDTQFWIKENMGEVDGVIFGDEKYLDLIDYVGKERILGVVDDLPENIERAVGLGLRAAIKIGNHNKWWRRKYIAPGSAVNGVGRLWYGTKTVAQFNDMDEMSNIIVNWKDGSIANYPGVL